MPNPRKRATLPATFLAELEQFRSQDVERTHTHVDDHRAPKRPACDKTFLGEGRADAPARALERLQSCTQPCTGKAEEVRAIPEGRGVRLVLHDGTALGGETAGDSACGIAEARDSRGAPGAGDASAEEAAVVEGVAGLEAVDDWRPGIPASAFYGGGGPRAAAEAARRRAAALRVPRAPVSREFFAQRDAFAFADTEAARRGRRGEELFVFARETDGAGRRRFFVTTHGELFRQLKRTTAQRGRHLYELIREGRPCCLYFDVEFARALNPGLDGAAGVAALLAALPAALARAYPALAFRVAPRDVVDLDSSTDKKFSRHLIIRPWAAPPGAPRGAARPVAFADNLAMGVFVRGLLAELLARAATEPAAAAVLAETAPEGARSPGTRRAMVDAGVYTRNRCFRTLLSAKFGRSAHLRPADEAAQREEGEEALFFRSLVCWVDDAAHLLLAPGVPEHPRGLPGAPPPAGAAGAAGGEWSVTSAAGGGGGAAPRGAEGSAVDPVADYVVRVWNERAGGARGFVRSRAAPPGQGAGARGVVVYRVEGNRFCATVGRAHRSNGIMLVVDAARGVFYQKCFDEDCRARGGRSEALPLPPHLAALVTGAGGGGGGGVGEEEEDFWARVAGMDDAELLGAGSAPADAGGAAAGRAPGGVTGAADERGGGGSSPWGNGSNGSNGSEAEDIGEWVEGNEAFWSEVDALLRGPACGSAPEAPGGTGAAADAGEARADDEEDEEAFWELAAARVELP